MRYGAKHKATTIVFLLIVSVSSCNGCRGRNEHEEMQELISQLNDDDSEVRRRATQRLIARRSEEAIDPLVATLQDDDRNVQLGAAVALAYTGGEKTIVAVRKLRKEVPSRTTQVSCGYVLAKLTSDASALTSLLEGLEDSDLNVRWLSGAYLGFLGSKKATGPLTGMLKHEKDKTTRARTVWALKKIGDVNAIEALVNALRDKDESIRVDAAEALSEITGHSFGENYERWKEWLDNKWYN